MAINPQHENAAIAAEYGIPRLRENRQQRLYYPIHLRRCTLLLQWVMIANVFLILVALYLFFSRPQESYYATAFNGKNTLLPVYALEQANVITQQNKLPGTPNS